MQVYKVRLVFPIGNSHGVLIFNRELYVLRRERLRERYFPNTKSSARARTNAILAGKCGSRRHSTTSFIVVVAKTDKTSCQMAEILSFSDRKRA